ncbi:MAG: isoaspartyl peptidase/L-asparaginase [Gemmatimonadaceae bacterium]|nr:isoaspartyl peptidase/L-asparaginase [Gemmatimonadaceae bacterium]
MTSRRDFLRTSAAAGVAGILPTRAADASPSRAETTAAASAPSIRRGRAVKPIVIADYSGFQFRNGGAENAVERAFRGITAGEDVLDALIAGVNIPELDPTENGIGYGALPNADGVVQLDASCMHGPKRRAGAVASIEGVRTPSLVAKAVMDLTDHHLIAGRDAREFARQLGFAIEEDLNTADSRRLWMEWRRRVDPEHWLDPNGTGRRRRDDNRPAHERDPDLGLAAGLSMVRDGLIREGSFWGTINCSGITPSGDLASVTTTSGLAWKIPGRVGDSPILGAGLYVDNDVGAAGSTGRGEANLYNLSSYLIVENLRRGMSPKDAGMDALRRIQKNTVERRLLNERGLPNFNVRFFVLDKQGRHAGVAMYHAGETKFALCTENGATAPDLEPLLPGSPS